MNPLPPAATETVHKAADEATTDLVDDISADLRSYGLINPETLRLALRLLADDVLEIGVEAGRRQEREQLTKLAAESGATYRKASLCDCGGDCGAPIFVDAPFAELIAKGDCDVV